ncbi:peptidase S8 [Aliivibrio fischeri]|nr:peptidase S8 [Aliivibrio fischeri]
MNCIAAKLNSLFSLSIIVVAMIFSMQVNAVTSLREVDESNFPKKYIVKFKEDASSFSELSEMSENQHVTEELVLEKLKAREVKRLGNSTIYSVEMGDLKLEQLRNRSDVEYVEIDQPRFLLRRASPDIWSGETTPWGYEVVGAQVVDDFNAGNRTVCIIDTGYDIKHNDLSGNRVSGPNVSDSNSDFPWSVPDPGGDNSHGTHVAGTISAIANSEGIKGIMPNQKVNLYIVKALNENGWVYSSDLVKAVQTCVDNGANVINMSLGGSKSTMTEKNGLQSIYEKGVLLIAAAGNYGDTSYSFPASYDSVMSVAAVDSNLDHAAFSQITDQVEIAAPGVAILSTVTVGEGVLSDISLNGLSQFKRGIVPYKRRIMKDEQYISDLVTGSITGILKRCDLLFDGTYKCGDMSNSICLIERQHVKKQDKMSLDNRLIKTCSDAGAIAAIVYSNAKLPGLQNPSIVDEKNVARIVSVTVDHPFGQTLLGYIGKEVTVSTSEGKDYEYYSGTSMATPHVAGVASLVWSYHPTCTAAQVRRALTETSIDIAEVGRDNRTGYGMVNAYAAERYLDTLCGELDWGPLPTL